MTETSGAAQRWVRDRYVRLSTTPFGVLGAGWVLYSVGVLGAVYGFLFLPPRGWGMLEIVSALALLLAVLVGASELLSRTTRAKLDQELKDLPFPVSGYADVLAQRDVETARLELSFEQPPSGIAIEELVAKADVPWLSCELTGETVVLIVGAAGGEGTNWRLNQRLRQAIHHVCVPTHAVSPVAAVSLSASTSSDRTSASDG